MVVREVVSVKVTVEQNSTGSEEASLVTTWEKSIPGRGAKALRISKEAGVDAAE